LLARRTRIFEIPQDLILETRAARAARDPSLVMQHLSQAEKSDPYTIRNIDRFGATIQNSCDGWHS
jgi:hypothetical protein